MSDVYRNNGYESRRDYLKSLADEFGVPKTVVYAMADVLGETEDFDGLVSALEDYVEYEM